jgi:AcrR family transcriptional regulator
MGRPRTITDEEILHAAAALFLERGPTTRTSDIADALGISEGTIFKRFPTKDLLLRRALLFEPLNLEPFLTESVGGAPVSETLASVVRQLIAFYIEMLPRAMMLRHVGAFDPMKEFQGDPDAPPLRVIHAITSYLSAEAQRGRIHLRDPEPAARMLMGAAMNHAFFGVSGIPGHDRLDEKQYANEVVQTLLEGIRSPGGTA